MTSIGRLPEKERRKMRRYNHIAKDLRRPKYSQKIVPAKKYEVTEEDWNEDR